jgi:hypothetical protein
LNGNELNEWSYHHLSNTGGEQHWIFFNLLFYHSKDTLQFFQEIDDIDAIYAFGNIFLTAFKSAFQEFNLFNPVIEAISLRILLEFCGRNPIEELENRIFSFRDEQIVVRILEERNKLVKYALLRSYGIYKETPLSYVKDQNTMDNEVSIIYEKICNGKYSLFFFFFLK